MKSIILGAAMLVSTPAMASYTMADFSGNMNPGNANVKAPFSGNGFTQGQAFSGSFVYNDQLVPAPGSGAVNVFFSDFPDFAAIPAVDAFKLSFGTLNFTLADNLDSLIPAGIRFNNGQFGGFVFNTDFLFAGNWYLFRADGPAITVKLLDNIADQYNPHGNPVPLTSSKINASFSTVLTNQKPYTPPPAVSSAVPEPATWAMMIFGLGLVGASMRRRSDRRTSISFV